MNDYLNHLYGIGDMANPQDDVKYLYSSTTKFKESELQKQGSTPFGAAPTPPPTPLTTTGFGLGLRPGAPIFVPGGAAKPASTTTSPSTSSQPITQASAGAGYAPPTPGTPGSFIPTTTC